MAFDDAVGIHELVNRPMRALFDAPDFVAAWTVVGGLVVAGLAALFLPFLRALPRR